MYYIETNKTCRLMPKYRPLREPYDSPERWPSCGAGLFSTPRDLLEFYRMLAFGGVARDGRRVLPKEAVDILATKQTPPGVKTAYSLGMFVEGEWFGHDGALKTAALLNPKRHAVWLWMMQCEYPGRINRWHQYKVWRPVVNRFFELLFDRNQVLDSVSGYAQRLGISPSYLNKLVRTQTRHSAMDWVEISRVNWAKSLLKESDMSVGEVSVAIGVDDPSYFTRFFRKSTGMTPSEFRHRTSRRPKEDKK
jgi:AraC-like DNA-binding protein